MEVKKALETKSWCMKNIFSKLSIRGVLIQSFFFRF